MHKILRYLLLDHAGFVQLVVELTPIQEGGLIPLVKIFSVQENNVQDLDIKSMIGSNCVAQSLH